MEQLTFECLLRIFMGCLMDRRLRDERKEKMRPREDFWALGAQTGSYFFYPLFTQTLCSSGTWAEPTVRPMAGALGLQSF